MNLVRVLDRLDDWINPIVVKELRQAVKSRLVIVILMVFLLLMLLVMGGSLMFQDAVGGAVRETIDAVTTSKGLRALTDEEWKPIMRDFFGR